MKALLTAKMRSILHYLFLAISATGLPVLAEEVLFDEVTIIPGELTEAQTEQSLDSDSIEMSSETPSMVTEQKILNSLGTALWKIIQFDLEITSVFNKKVAGPIMQAIKKRGEPEGTLLKVLALLQRDIANANSQK